MTEDTRESKKAERVGRRHRHRSELIEATAQRWGLVAPDLDTATAQRHHASRAVPRNGGAILDLEPHLGQPSSVAQHDAAIERLAL